MCQTFDRNPQNILMTNFTGDGTEKNLQKRNQKVALLSKKYVKMVV